MRKSEYLFFCLVMGILLFSLTGRANAGLHVKEPAKTEKIQPREYERSRWSWNKTPVEITSTGDLKWKPKSFKFKAGKSIRYIDFEKGDDGKWHHVIVEADRKAKLTAIYIDGKKAIEGALNMEESGSLSNTGHLYAGRNEEGNYFAGAIEFLRIARGTLKDSKTSIEELYDWQFDGPFLRDFRGKEQSGECCDAGAFEWKGN